MKPNRSDNRGFAPIIIILIIAIVFFFMFFCCCCCGCFTDLFSGIGNSYNTLSTFQYTTQPTWTMPVHNPTSHNTQTQTGTNGQGTTSTETVTKEGETNAPEIVNPEDVEATVMIYMNGTDLESDFGNASADIEEILNAGSSDKVHVVIETIGTANWQTAGISNSQAQRFVVENGQLTKVVDSLGKVSVADPEPLADFIHWANVTYPAPRNILILWNHGGGPAYGFGVDEWDEKSEDSLFLNEICDALELAGRKGLALLEDVADGTCQCITLNVPELSYLYLCWIDTEGRTHRTVEADVMVDVGQLCGLQDEVALVLERVDGINDVIVGVKGKAGC